MKNNRKRAKVDVSSLPDKNIFTQRVCADRMDLL